MVYIKFFEMGDYLDCIEEIRSGQFDDVLSGRLSCEASFMYYWEIFAYLPPLLAKTLIVTSSVVLLVTLLLLRSPSAALIGTCMNLSIVIEIWGFLALWASMNSLILAYLLLAYGISVEFTAHIIAFFTVSQGDASQRLRIALKATVPAIILGGISTMMAILPLFFAPIPFARNSTAACLYLIQALGFFTGLLVLPSVLSTFAYLLGLCGFKFERVSTKRNSKTQEPQATTTTAEAEQFEIDNVCTTVSPIRSVKTSEHLTSA